MAKSGTLSIPVGATSGRIGITIKGDTVNEANERFTVILAAPTNATVGDGQATGVIRNS